MSEAIELLKKSGYPSKAIEYYVGKVSVGEIEDPSVNVAYTDPCGDTMEIFLKSSPT